MWVETNPYQIWAPGVYRSRSGVIELQVDELLKTREKVHESFTSIPAPPKKVSSSSSNNDDGKGVGEDPVLTADEGDSPTAESSADKANKSKKWFNLNFKTSMSSAAK